MCRALLSEEKSRPPGNVAVCRHSSEHIVGVQGTFPGGGATVVFLAKCQQDRRMNQQRRGCQEAHVTHCWGCSYHAGHGPRDREEQQPQVKLRTSEILAF